MESLSFDKQESRGFFWREAFFYLNAVAFVFAAFCYFTIVYLINVQKQANAALHNDLSVYGSQEQRLSEERFLEQKRKIEDFARIISGRKISSNLFNIVEKHTMPDVWFSSFESSLTDNRLELTGEAENMGALSRQIRVFEENQKSIRSVTVLNSQSLETGKVSFVLSILLSPEVF